eukprot:286620-Pelagomonas_calceolata.AAC.1
MRSFKVKHLPCTPVSNGAKFYEHCSLQVHAKALMVIFHFRGSLDHETDEPFSPKKTLYERCHCSAATFMAFILHKVFAKVFASRGKLKI